VSRQVAAILVRQASWLLPRTGVRRRLRAALTMSRAIT
jgi:hypothetical protein